MRKYIEGREKTVILLVLALYPLLSLPQQSAVFGVPFDSETIHRFIIPFTFQQGGADTVEWTLTESIQHGFTRPIYSLSFLVDHTLWGTDFRLYHLTDFLLSWLTYAMIFFLFRRKLGLPVTVLALVLWTLHPVQTFSMASFTGRNDRLLVIFTLLTILLCDRAFQNRVKRKAFLLLALGTSVLGTFAKESSLPYLALSFGWCWIALGKSFISVARIGRILWISGAILFALLMLTKPVISPQLIVPIEVSGNVLTKFARLVDWGLPVKLSPDLFTGAAAFLLLSLLILCRRFPREVRFGAFLTLVSLMPFVFVWVQKTFLWLPVMGICLMVSSLVVHSFRYFSAKPYGRALSVFLLSAVVALTGFWGYRAGRNQVALPISVKLAVEYLYESQDGPVYSTEGILEQFPVLRRDFARNAAEPEILSKSWNYFEQLLQIRAGTLDVALYVTDI